MIEYNINPVLFDFGAIKIYYYSLVYVLGILFLYYFFRHLVKEKKLELNLDDIDDFIVYLTLGIIIGGRLGEFLFYNKRCIFSTE